MDRGHKGGGHKAAMSAQSLRALQAFSDGKYIIPDPDNDKQLKFLGHQ